MAVLKIKCDCGKNISSKVGNRIYNNKLYWFQSYSCDNCGKTIEMESDDKMPTDIKDAIIEEGGNYVLILKETKDRRKAEFLLKKMPNSSLLSLKPFLERECEEIIKGTRNEVLIVKNYLAKRGIDSCII